MENAGVATTTAMPAGGWSTHHSLALIVPCVQLLLILLTSCFGGQALKQEVKSLFAFKAPATVLALFWKDTIIHSVMALLLGSGDGTLHENTVDPNAIGTDLTALIMKCSSVSAFLLLALTLVPLASVVESVLAAQHFDEHRSLLLASFKMSPCWSFKSIVQNVLADLNAAFASSPAWMYSSLWAITILALATVASLALPAPAQGQSYGIAVVALMGASLHPGVAFSFNDIAKVVAGKGWNSLNFQSIYAPCATAVCFAATLLLAHASTSPNATIKKVMGFLSLVPSFVAAWACQALGQASIEVYWPVSSGAWEIVNKQLFASGSIGIISLVLVCVQSAIINDQTTHDFLTSVAGLNVGFAWKTLGTDLYDALGQRLHHLWIITAVLTLTLPLLAGGLLHLAGPAPKSQKPEDAVPLKEGKEKEDQRIESNSFPFFCCRRHANPTGNSTLSPQGYAQVTDATPGTVRGLRATP
eukprot:TRINITY_DN47208_c0_g1_i1.p1 TRINITY_DN47208_c0_g1~~TRINITY_DN47208_c0_g1_i1.p1  ORF type:complete len:485 (-),score=48.17 TRINITY_DN47208_c0_g1_i1:76-1494(-)